MSALKAELLQHPEVVAFCLKRAGVPVFYLDVGVEFTNGYRWGTGEGFKGDGPYWVEFVYSPHVKTMAPYKLPFPKCVFVIDHAGKFHSLFTAEVAHEHVGDGHWVSRVVLEGKGVNAWNNSPVLKRVDVIRDERNYEEVVALECDYEYVQAVDSWVSGSIAYWPQSDLTDSVVASCMGVYLAAFESALLQIHAAPTTAYIPSPNRSNAKRIAKGKKPLIDWTTVVVQPRKPRGSEPLGGTHASPRRHERRGHYRVSSKGTRHWVKNHWVGSAQNGLVFHDYEVLQA